MSCYNLLRWEQQAFWESLTHQAGDTCDLQMREWFRATGAQLLRAAGKMPALEKAEAEEWSSKQVDDFSKAFAAMSPLEKAEPEQRWGVMLVGSDGVARHWCFDKNGDRVYSTRAEAEKDRAETVVTIGNYRAEVRPYPGPSTALVPPDNDRSDALIYAIDIDMAKDTDDTAISLFYKPSKSSIRTFTEHALAVAIASSDPALLAIVDRVSEGDPKRRDANIGKAVERDEAGATTAAKAIAKRAFGGKS